MAKTGETRKTKQPLKIDRLPAAVHDAILFLRNERGKTWEEIEALSAEPYNEKWKYDGGGFVDWTALPFDVLEQFPDMKLGQSLLHRWWDLRVSQVQASVERMAVQAKSIAKVFAKTARAGDKDSIQSAARDILLGILAEDATVRGRKGVASGLIKLGELMQMDSANKIKERKVAVEERKIRALEAREQLAIRKLEAEAETLTKKAVKGEVTPDDIDRLRQRVFGLPPKAKAAA